MYTTTLIETYNTHTQTCTRTCTCTCSHFIQARLYFLPVVRTHEDIDQLSPQVSKQLKRKGGETLQGLVYYSLILCW